MTLQTNLDHISTADQFNEIINENENVMICCGRMGPMCLPVYAEMEDPRDDCGEVKFYDMLFDNPEAGVIRNLPECATFMGLPFTVYFKNGQLVNATSSIQSREQIMDILNDNFCN